MSIEAMNWAYRQTVGDGITKSILVVLANMADQDGKCWPSIDYIQQRTEFSRATVVNRLTQLAEAGYIEKQKRAGDGGGRKSTLYHLNLGAKFTAQTLGQSSPQKGQSSPGEPKQSIEQSIKGLPAWIDAEVWAQFVQHRKEIKKTLKPTATKALLAKLDKYREQGADPNRALLESIENQWQGVFPERLLEKTNGTTQHGPGRFPVRETASQRSDRKKREALAAIAGAYPT